MDSQQLTDREIDILKLVAQAKSNKEIAAQLFISVNTVKVHLANIFQKIGVASRTEAALYAIEHNLVASRLSVLIENQDDVVEIGTQISQLNSRFSNIKRSTIIWTVVPVLIVIVGLVIIFSAYQRSRAPATSFLAPTNQKRWVKVGEITDKLSKFAITNYDHRIIMIGGEEMGNIISNVRIYDPQKNEIQRGASKPTPVKEIQAGIIGELCYVPGGATTDGVSNVLEVYNPRLDRWSLSTPIPQPLTRYALATFEGKLYLFGGNDGTQVMDTVFIFDPTSRIWSRGTSMPTARQNANANLVGSKIIISGGDDGESILRETIEYYPGRDGEVGAAWKKTTQTPEPCNDCKAVSSGSNIFLFNKNLVYIYDSISGDWSIEKRSEAPTVAQFGGVESYRNGVIFLGGVQENGKYAKDVWFYVTQYSLVIPFLNN